MLAILAYDPLVCGLLTEDHYAISIIDPILSRHHLLHTLKFLAELHHCGALLSNRSNLVLNGLPRIAVGTAWVHGSQANVFNVLTNYLSDGGLLSQFQIFLPQVHNHLQRGLGGAISPACA